MPGFLPAVRGTVGCADGPVPALFLHQHPRRIGQALQFRQFLSQGQFVGLQKRVVPVELGHTMSSIVQHGLIQRDRIFSVSVLLPDKPGELVRVAATIADAQGNVIKLEHNQFVSTNRNAAVELRITMEAFGTEHKNEIMKALEDEGFRPREIGAKLY